MNKYAIDFQLDPPHMHRQNAAEWAIITCENHFISGFSIMYLDFPISKLEQLIYQCLVVMNLLHNSRFNPDL